MGQSVGVICEIAAPDADGMYLTDFLSYSHKVRHRAERLTEEIGVKAGYDHANPTVGEFLCDIHKRHVVELGLVYSHHLDFRTDVQHLFRILHGMARDLVKIMGDHVILGISCVNCRLEDLDPEVGELGSPDPADQLFCLAGEHRAANDFNTSGFFYVF